MKKIFLGTIFSFLFLGLSAQEQQKDTIAVMILQRMSDVIGELNSVSFHMTTATDVMEFEIGVVTYFGWDDVYMVGPDKMLVHAYGHNGHRGYYYNGSVFAYYSFDENNYAEIPAPPTIMATIDSIHDTYGITFPAADFFYPTFVGDVLDYFDNLIYMGKEVIEGQECFHILASNQDMVVQFWIANDAFNLPKKFVLIYKNKDNMQYEASFSDWKLNTDIPNPAFDFLPPPQAQEIYMMPK